MVPFTGVSSKLIGMLERYIVLAGLSSSCNTSNSLFTSGLLFWSISLVSSAARSKGLDISWDFTGRTLWSYLAFKVFYSTIPLLFCIDLLVVSSSTKTTFISDWLNATESYFFFLLNEPIKDPWLGSGFSTMDAPIPIYDPFDKGSMKDLSFWSSNNLWSGWDANNGLTWASVLSLAVLKPFGSMSFLFIILYKSLTVDCFDQSDFFSISSPSFSISAASPV